MVAIVYKICENCRLEHPNKLYTGDVHLFNCSKDGLTLINSIINNTKDKSWFTLQHILMDMRKTLYKNNVDNPEKFLHECLLYLLRVNVLEAKLGHV